MLLPISQAISFRFGTHSYNGIEINGLGLTYAGQIPSFLTVNWSAFITSPFNVVGFNLPFLFQPTATPLLANTALVLATDATTYSNGPILTASLGAGGTGYAANDTGTITTGTGDATYKVLTVGALGAVLTFQITGGGTAYAPANGVATATGGAQPGVGINLTVNITTVTPGDGTLKVITYYQIIPVP
jgi:hypothetical protein